MLAKKLLEMQELQDTLMHRKIMDTAEQIMADDDYSLADSLNQAIRKRKFLVDAIIPDSKPCGEPDFESDSEPEYEENEE